jgi:hypothetical protein
MKLNFNGQRQDGMTNIELMRLHRRMPCAPLRHSLPIIDGGGQVIPFRSRKAAPRRDFGIWHTPDHSQVRDIDSFGCALESSEDYRRRMSVNFVAAIFLAALTITASWVFYKLAETQQTQYSINHHFARQ